MVIGSSSLAHHVKSLGLFLLAWGVVSLSVLAQDQITKKDGTVVSGKITGVSDGAVSINPTIVYLTDIQSVTMATPDAVAQVKGAAPATVIAALAPLVKQFAGLPALWVIAAMGELADAYDASGNADAAAATYAQINQFYPNSPYQNAATAGVAKLDLKQGKTAEAMALVKPLIDKANQNIAPSPEDGQIFANAFLVYGQALQQQKQFPQALEAYLTVKTMFYQNPALVEQADQLAKTLRQQNPGVTVD